MAILSDANRKAMGVILVGLGAFQAGVSWIAVQGVWAAVFSGIGSIIFLFGIVLLYPESAERTARTKEAKA